MSNLSVKGFSDSNFNQAFIGKVSICKEIAQNFTYSQKSYFLKSIIEFFWFTASTLYGRNFSFFASCEPLNNEVK